MDWKAFLAKTKRIAAWVVPLIILVTLALADFAPSPYPAYFLSFLLGLGWLIGIAPQAFRTSRRIGRRVAVGLVAGAMGSWDGITKWGHGVVDEAKRRP